MSIDKTMVMMLVVMLVEMLVVMSETESKLLELMLVMITLKM